MIVVGLTGHSGAGKDSVADVLVRDHGFTKLSFAGPVKRALKRLDPIVGNDVYQDCDECPPEVEEVRLSDVYAYGYNDETIKDSPWGAEIRNLWQQLGTETIRAEDPNFWVDLAQMELLELGADRVVFTDVRFPNEAEMIYNLSVPIFTGPGGDLIFSPFIPSVWQVSRVGDEILYPDDHESESHVGMLNEEIQLINAGTLEDLVEPVALALEFMLDDEGIPSGWVQDMLPLDIFEASHE